MKQGGMEYNDIMYLTEHHQERYRVSDDADFRHVLTVEDLYYKALLVLFEKL